VTAGAILGAGYAIAFVLLLQTLWNFIGKKYFPAWHTQLPNRLQPEAVPKSEIGNRKRNGCA
jgi:hypothetical protein